MKWQRRNRNMFLSKKSNLDQMVKHTFIENNRAIIPCRVNSYSDIISPYSEKHYETLNTAFQDYLMDTVSFIPDEYPVVLQIRGGNFDAEERNAINQTIRTEMLYYLGETETVSREAFRNFLLMVAGAVGMGIFLTVMKFVVAIAEEFFYIVFWFFADTLVRYLLHDRSLLSYNRLLAGRLASMTVEFVDEENREPVKTV